MDSNASYADERTRILRLVEDGALSANEAISLLENLGAGRRVKDTVNAAQPAYADVPLPPEAPAPPEAPGATPAQSASQSHPNGAPRWLRIRVSDVDSGRNKVSVNIPFRLANWGLRMGARFSPEVGNVDLSELSDLLQQDGLSGKLIDVVDEDDGEHVEIYVE